MGRQLREFTPGADRHLHVAPLLDTPGAALNGSSVLRDFVSANEEAVRTGQHRLPEWMTAGSADLLRYAWTIPDVDQETLAAFTRGTCNGCHAEISPLDRNFHVSPFRTGMDRLSPLVLGEEMTRRVATTKAALCAP